MTLSPTTIALFAVGIALAVWVLWPKPAKLEAPKSGSARASIRPTQRRPQGRLAPQGGRRIYLAVRRWVDWDLNEHARPFSLFIAGLPILIAIFLGSPASGGAVAAGWAIAVLASVAGLAFVAWRMSRLLRAAALKGDRWYDRIGKHNLPPEYGASESATQARRARRQTGKIQGRGLPRI